MAQTLRIKLRSLSVCVYKLRVEASTLASVSPGRGDKVTAKRSRTCEICGRTLSNSGRLKSHMNTHAGRPYQCQRCPKAYTSVSNLTRHVKKNHTQEAAVRNTPAVQEDVGSECVQSSLIKCILCGRYLKSFRTYKIHVNLHTQQSSYKCHLCNLELPSSQVLWRHKKKKHQPKPTARQHGSDDAKKGQDSPPLPSDGATEASEGSNAGQPCEIMCKWGNWDVIFYETPQFLLSPLSPQHSVIVQLSSC